jgi:hypothetical protein
LAEWRQIVAAKLAEQAEEVLDAAASKSPKGGRPAEEDSAYAIARMTGLPRTTIQQTRQHVEVGERYPMLKEPNWGKRPALEAANLLDEMPTKVRNTTLDLVQKEVFDVDPRAVKLATQIIQNVASFSPEKQEQVVALYRAKDDNEKKLAITIAGKRPPMPDPRVSLIKDICSSLRQVVKLSKDELREVVVKEADKCTTILKALEGKICAAHQARVAEVVKT